MAKIGIYKIQNTKNDKFYIGSSSNVSKRWAGHRYQLRTETHTNPHLQNSWNKYGESCFIFKILLLCQEFDLLYYEQHYIDLLVPEYNIAKFAGRALVGSTHQRKLTEEQVIEIRTKFSDGDITYMELSKEYNIYCGHIRDIILNNQWKSLKTPKLNKKNSLLAATIYERKREKIEENKIELSPEEKLLEKVLGLKTSEIVVESVKIHWSMIQYD